jgi:hypothetical protein
MSVPFFFLLPLFHAFNPLSIASLVRVDIGLNRCGSFRIQQQVLHSDAGNSVPVFLIEVPLFIVTVSISGMASVREHRSCSGL